MLPNVILSRSAWEAGTAVAARRHSCLRRSAAAERELLESRW